jgi:hypothetical protein
VRSLTAAFSSTSEGASFYEDRRRQWIEEKDKYMNILAKVAQALGPVLDVASFAVPQYAAQLFIAKGFSGVVQEMVDSARKGSKKSGGKNSYVAIGNYHFIGGGHAFALDHTEEDKERNLTTIRSCIFLYP